MPTPPPRLHVLLATDAPYGVVIRRAPTKTTCTIGWDRERDTFQVGQWVRARVYSDLSDLSPDGRHLIYYALDGRWESSLGGAYTGISRAPYLKALVLYRGIGRWSRSGYWVGPGRYRMLDGREPVRDCDEVAREPRGMSGAATWVRRLLSQQPVPAWLRATRVYEARLLRAGWRRTRPPVSSQLGLERWERTLANGWSLTKIIHDECRPRHDRAFGWEEHLVTGGMPAATVAQPNWEWADLDRDRLVYASGGSLWAVPLHDEGLGPPTCLHDFNGMEFEAIAAPY